ncbi:MAG TPA: YARHG domain-containing protein [Aestuariivirgaceae bacterium]|jgi:hypothetical protein
MARKAIVTLALAVAAAIQPAPAQAVCLQQDLFCTDQYVISRPLLHDMDCKALWTLRNTVLDERGYCFPRREEAEAFDNSNCTNDTYGTLDLNAFERDNIALILSVERSKFCR